METIYNINSTTDNTKDNRKFIKACADVKNVVANFRFIDDREEKLEEILSSYLGDKFYFDTLPMGSGGVGKIKRMKNGTTRIQFGYGKGKYNYARTLVIQ